MVVAVVATVEAAVAATEAAMEEVAVMATPPVASLRGGKPLLLSLAR